MTVDTLVHTIIVKAGPGGYDPDGDPVAASGDDVTVTGCAVAPRRAGTEEINDRGRSGTIVGYTVYAPLGTVVTKDDLIEWDGVTYEVEGEPGIWSSPFPGPQGGGVEIAIRRAAG